MARLKSVEERVNAVRDAVAEAATGLTPSEYRELMETLCADAEGWKAEMEETDGEF